MRCAQLQAEAWLFRHFRCTYPFSPGHVSASPPHPERLDLPHVRICGSRGWAIARGHPAPGTSTSPG